MKVRLGDQDVDECGRMVCMKYFTADVWIADQDLQCEVPASEEPVAEYRRYLESVQDLLPCGYRALNEQVFLHDSILRELRVDLASRTASIALDYCTRHDGVECDTRVLYSRVEGVASSSDFQKSLSGSGGFGDLGFDEIEVLGEGRFEHRMLFSSGIEVSVVFGGLDFELELSSTEVRKVERGHRQYGQAMEALKRGDEEVAEARLRESWEATHHSEAAERLGRLLMDRCQDHGALLWLAASVGLGNGSSSARALVAEILKDYGDELGAWNQVQKALEENPECQEARALAAELEGRQSIRSHEGREEA